MKDHEDIFKKKKIKPISPYASYCVRCLKVTLHQNGQCLSCHIHPHIL